MISVRSIVLASALLLIGCRPPVEVTRAADFVTYRTGDVRVYLSQRFLEGLGGYGSPQEVDRHYQDQLAAVGSLFERRLLTGEMFYRAAGVTPTRRAPHSYAPRPTASLEAILESDNGPLLKILFHYITILPGEPTMRTIQLRVTFSAQETGWGSQHIFNLKLKNPRADASTPAMAFSAGAAVLRLDYQGIEL